MADEIPGTPDKESQKHEAAQDSPESPAPEMGTESADSGAAEETGSITVDKDDSAGILILGQAEAVPVGEETETPDTAPDSSADPAGEEASEPEPEVAAESAAMPPPAPPPQPPPRRGGWLPPLIGGVIAAGIGFSVSHFDLLDLGSNSNLTADMTTLRAEIASLRQDSTKAEKKAEEALQAASAIPGDISKRMDGFAAQLDAQDKTLAGLGKGGGLGGVPFRSEIPPPDETIIRDLVDAEIDKALDARAAKAEAEARAEADAIRAAARRDAAIASLKKALDEGGPYASALKDLPADGIPAVLADHAETGLPTQADLANSFPDQARIALKESIHADAGQVGERVLSFLRIQTGARSLVPREGNDPDAVLSRVQSQIDKGDLPAALSEISDLPPEGQAALANWIDSAKTRLAAEHALATLIATIAP